MFQFCTRKEAKKLRFDGKEVIDVSSKGAQPYNQLSPMYPHGGLRVPGMSYTFADSVEGIWQGLKVFKSKGVDTSRFVGPGKKRPGKPQGHQYQDRLLGYREARYKIYKPLYSDMVKTKATSIAQKMVLDMYNNPRTVYVHDYESNPDIDDLSKPFAHASLLVDILNENVNGLYEYDQDLDTRQEYLDHFQGIERDPELARLLNEGYQVASNYLYPLAANIIFMWLSQGRDT